MIYAITLLLGCQLLGEILVGLTGLPIPGPVVGGVALAVGLLVRGRVGDEVAALSNAVLRNLSLLFVPAAVGVIEYRDVFLQNGVALVVALVASTVLALAASALTFRFVASRFAR